MKESALAIGDDGSLVGVLSEPEHDRRPDLAVLILNSGLVHKVGPYRMSVELSRRLASAGVATLRFDLGGIGDSPASPAKGDYLQRATEEIRWTMDTLERRGRRRFLVVGVCSGARNAHRAAVADERVAGVVALDGNAWPTPRFYLLRYGPRLVDPSSWRRLVRRRAPAALSHLLGAPDGPPTDVRTEIYEDEELPPRREMARELRELVQRRVRMLYVFTAGWNEYCNYRGQMFDAFSDVSFDGLLEVERFADADHTYTLVEHRDRLLDLIESWVSVF